MTPTSLLEPIFPQNLETRSSDDAERLSEDIAIALGEGTLYLLLDPAAVWLVD